jgi:beta-fructofuranosidase
MQLPRLEAELTSLRALAANDPHRPQYHFTPPANWLNDPNGAIEWDGKYHLFYQYNPAGAFWGTIHWGHAISPDLVHWEDCPIALTPSPGGADAGGCWSGYAINDNGVPTLIYTGVTQDGTSDWKQVPCLATGDPTLTVWTKYDGNPLISEPPASLDVNGFRDHCLWQDENGRWYQAIGTGFKQGGGAILLYTSTDLRHWEYLHPLLSGDNGRDGECWECPDFFAADGSHVLLFSSMARQQQLYMTGRYEDLQFIAQNQDTFDLGECLYAGQSFRDSQGRRILWGWLREARNAEGQIAAGWSGAMSLPLVLGVRPDGQLSVNFASELQNLRRNHYRLSDFEMTETTFQALSKNGDCLEIQVEFENIGAREFGLVFRRSPDGAEETRLTYDAEVGQLLLDRRNSTLDQDCVLDIKGGLCPLADGKTLRLHLYLDRSALELSANGYRYLSGRIYPSRPDSLGLGLYALGGNVRVKSFDVWELGSSWE